MPAPAYQFVVELFSEDGRTSLGQFPVDVDWEPAREHLQLLALRRGTPSGAADAVVEPAWSETPGEPHAVGARLRDGDLVCEIPLAYFRPLAVEASSDLVEKKVLQSGEHFTFKLFAHRRAHPARNGSGMAFTVRDATPPIPFVEGALADLQSASAPSGDTETGDVPVFIPQQVLAEAEAITREAGALETGGILIGRIHRDASLPELAVVVTAQIPVHHTEAKTTKLTFTAETWTAVRVALDLRKSGEIMLGWWHSHPSFAFCNAECPPERRKVCALQKPFLSGDDLLLHRTVFPKAFHVALLANNADAGLDIALFGWSGGTVQRRGFHILGADRSNPEPANEFSTATSTGDHAHATPCKT